MRNFLIIDLLVFDFLLIAINTNAYVDVRFEDHEICTREFKLWKLCDPMYKRCLESSKGQCQKELESCMKRYNTEQFSHACGKSVSYLVEKLIANEARTIEKLKSNALTNLLIENEKESCFIYKRVLNISKQSKATDRLISHFPSLVSNICSCDNLQNSDQPPRAIFFSHIWHGGISSDACWKEVDQRIVREYCGKDSMAPINHVWVQYRDCLKTSHVSQCFLDFKKQLNKTVMASSKRLTCKSYFTLIDTYLEIDGNSQTDYEIQYLTDADLRFLESECYDKDTVYLYQFENDDVYKYCINNTGEASFCMISRYYCLQNRSTISVKNHPDDCDSNLVVCFNEIVNVECRNKLLTEIGKDKSFLNLVIWLIREKIPELFINHVVKMVIFLFVLVLFLYPLTLIMKLFFDWSTGKMQCAIDEAQMKKGGIEMKVMEQKLSNNESTHSTALSPIRQHSGNNDNNEIGGDAMPITLDEIECEVPDIPQDPNSPSESFMVVSAQAETPKPAEGKATKTPESSDEKKKRKIRFVGNKKNVKLVWESFKTFCATFVKWISIICPITDKWRTCISNREASTHNSYTELPAV